jgi:hypothetical protein
LKYLSNCLQKKRLMITGQEFSLEACVLEAVDSPVHEG